MLVLKWSICGFLLTISYKSVLRVIMMSTEYDDTIDTIDDMLQSERQFMVAGDTGLRRLVETDPRPKVKILAKEVKYFDYGTIPPEEVAMG